MDTITEREINELEKLILFYENLGETNNHIENYKKEYADYWKDILGVTSLDFDLKEEKED
jgi:hypothetical protein